MDSAEAFALADIDATGQGALVAAGQLTAVGLLDAAIIRLEAARGLNAVIHDLFDRARRQAAELDASARARSGGAGPLAGVPFLLKDLGASLQALRRRWARGPAQLHRDGDGVDRRPLPGRGPGGVRQDNTPEWGNHCTTEPSLFGPTVNPWSPSITPGGVERGSASAMAAGVPPRRRRRRYRLVRVPALCCGLVGLKPRRGRSSFAPVSGHAIEGLAQRTRTHLQPHWSPWHCSMSSQVARPATPTPHRRRRPGPLTRSLKNLPHNAFCWRPPRRSRVANRSRGSARGREHRTAARVPRPHRRTRLSHNRFLTLRRGRHCAPVHVSKCRTSRVGYSVCRVPVEDELSLDVGDGSLRASLTYRGW